MRILSRIWMRLLKWLASLIKRMGAFGDSLFRISILLSARTGVSYLVALYGITKRGSPYTSGQGYATLQKWELIKANLNKDSATAIDVGIYTGYLTFCLAKHVDFVIGIEPDPDLFRLCQFLVRHNGIHNCALSSMSVSPDNIHTLPSADIYSVLSVMQNWAQSYDWDTAASMLHNLWTKTNHQMFFELPNPLSNATRAPYLPDMGNTEQEVRLYLARMLSKLPNSEVTFLGYLPTDFRSDGEHRHIFVIRRRVS